MDVARFRLLGLWQMGGATRPRLVGDDLQQDTQHHVLNFEACEFWMISVEYAGVLVSLLVISGRRLFVLRLSMRVQSEEERESALHAWSDMKNTTHYVEFHCLQSELCHDNRILLNWLIMYILLCMRECCWWYEYRCHMETWQDGFIILVNAIVVFKNRFLHFEIPLCALCCSFGCRSRAVDCLERFVSEMIRFVTSVLFYSILWMPPSPAG